MQAKRYQGIGVYINQCITYRLSLLRVYPGPQRLTQAQSPRLLCDVWNLRFVEFAHPPTDKGRNDERAQRTKQELHQTNHLRPETNRSIIEKQLLQTSQLKERGHISFWRHSLIKFVALITWGSRIDPVKRQRQPCLPCFRVLYWRRVEGSFRRCKMVGEPSAVEAILH